MTESKSSTPAKKAPARKRAAAKTSSADETPDTTGSAISGGEAPKEPTSVADRLDRIEHALGLDQFRPV